MCVCIRKRAHLLNEYLPQGHSILHFRRDLPVHLWWCIMVHVLGETCVLSLERPFSQGWTKKQWLARKVYLAQRNSRVNTYYYIIYIFFVITGQLIYTFIIRRFCYLCNKPFFYFWWCGFHISPCSSNHTCTLFFFLNVFVFFCIGSLSLGFFGANTFYLN